MTRHKLLPVTLTMLLLGGCAAIPKQFVSTDQSHRKGDLVQGDPMYRITAPGAIRAIDNPKWATVAQSQSDMQPDEPVIVYQQDGETRVYSTWTLNNHEIVNDYVGDTAIAVTW